MSEVPKLYTFKETQEKLGGISRNLMNKLIAEQAIEFKVIGHRKYAFTEDAILAYLESRTVRVKTAPVTIPQIPVPELPKSEAPHLPDHESNATAPHDGE